MGKRNDIVQLKWNDVILVLSVVEYTIRKETRRTHPLPLSLPNPNPNFESCVQSRPPKTLHYSVTLDAIFIFKVNCHCSRLPRNLRLHLSSITQPLIQNFESIHPNLESPISDSIYSLSWHLYPLVSLNSPSTSHLAFLFFIFLLKFKLMVIECLGT